jgi:hypothetical protein
MDKKIRDNFDYLTYKDEVIENTLLYIYKLVDFICSVLVKLTVELVYKYEMT